MRRCLPLILLLALSGCSPDPGKPTEITLQRFFGACDADYAASTDIEKAEGECGIITTLVNRFNVENPDIHVRVNVVYWPGYDQLSAALAAGDPPDLVSMHQSVISDYADRHLIEPVETLLAEAGIHDGDFTPAARAGVSRDGHLYGLPFDSWTMLWHVNLGLFRAAGLVQGDGTPILPRSPEELIAQARQFRQATGKPYLIETEVNDQAALARTLLTYLMQQNSDGFADPRHVRLQTPEARRILSLLRQLREEGLSTRDLDYTGATRAFLNGQGGVYLVGTWMIGSFDEASRRPGSPLAGGYAVKPYPQLYPGRDVSYGDGHAWVVPARKRTDKQREAVKRLLGYLGAHDFAWSRTGHLPAFTAVIDSPNWRALPHRSDIARLAETTEPLPPGVQRQFLIQEILCQEMESAITGQKSIDRALGDGERRINDLLSNLL